MAENFDQVHPEDRSFILGGQTFHWQPMWWRDFGEMVEETVKKAEAESEAAEKAEKARASGKKVPDTSPTLVDTYEQLIEGICKFLEPSEVESFQAIVNDRTKRISHVQLTELRDWLREVTNNRPTEQPSPSGDGHGSTGPTLRVASS